ncbi:hypothetical protein BDV25DRAFT_156781 [Aspergillus avenaceus]|uniref:F-box domain-containing protein n=1 Tax=Aspergillus avenaceus TaxID=36643 RepID=A0A5N6TS84_ASPAV|nr:hypothetical protein BDV25DRAFT_156781 [Aspergillus avenaceus]
MPDPANLPLELFEMVLDLALIEPTKHQLCGLALLSRRWYEAVMVRLYKEWHYNGARQPFMTLWMFLRTILRNPKVAALIRFLVIGNWGFYTPAMAVYHPKYGDHQIIELPEEDLDLVRAAISEAGISSLESSIIQSLHRRDRRPLMALLLTRLPNLMCLEATVPPHDPVLGSVLQEAMRRQRAGHKVFSRLTDLIIRAEVDVPPSHGESIGPLTGIHTKDEFNYLWSIMFLQGLQTLSLAGVHHKLIVLKTNPRVPYSQKLHVEANEEVRWRFTDIRSLLSLPAKLASFSFNVYNAPLKGALALISNKEIWEALQIHSENLETLEVFRHGPDYQSGKESSHHFGLLKSFTRLKYLGIQVEILLGGSFGLPIAPFRLADTLPCSLETLVFNGCTCDGVPDFPLQIEELLQSPEFPSLKSISMEDLCSYEEESDHDTSSLYKTIGQACDKRGVDFQLSESFDFCGRPEPVRTPGAVFGMERDGARRSSMFKTSPARFHDPHELILPRIGDDDLWGETARIASEIEEDPHGKTFGENEHFRALYGRPTVHARFFADHAGEAAYMVFHNKELVPLPPLYSFALYFTHAEASEKTVDMVGFYKELFSPFWPSYCFRLDFYFIPGGSAHDCMSHYRAEKAARGDHHEQLIAYKKHRDETDQPRGQLPGMVNEYPGGVLHICPNQNWNDEERAFLSVLFDPDDTCEKSIRIRRAPIDAQSPLYDPKAGKQTVQHWMLDLASRYSQGHTRPWEKATNKGWTAWPCL